MELTFKISDKIIKECSSQIIDDFLFNNYSSEDLAGAKIPKKNAILKEYLADAKFMNKFEKELVYLAKEKIEDYMYDILCDIRSNVIDFYTEECEKAYNANKKTKEAERSAKRIAEEIEQASKLLVQAGYTVTK